MTNRDEINRFKAMLEALGWRFEMDGADLQVTVGDTPAGLTQHDCWRFVRDWNDQRRLAAAEVDTVH
jgi:hypothetical protein